MDHPAASYKLTHDQIAQYRENGHILLKGVCPPSDISRYRDAIVDAAAKKNTETRELKDRDTYGKAFLQIMNLWVDDMVVKEYTLSKRFGQIAAQLMEVDGARLYHDQALFKEPGGGHTPWHQDQFYWPLDAKRTITMWMPLVDISAEMGSMSFANGSQVNGYIPITDQISDASESFFDRLVHEKGFTISGGGAMNAGDATFHSGWTLHRAPGNVTDRMREAMTVIYYPDGTRVTKPENAFQENDRVGWLDSIESGALATGPLNPLVFP